jgi:hypothetical protein
MVEFVKRHAWWFIGPTIVCAMVGVWIAIPPAPLRFTQEQSVQVQLGMTWPQVYEVLGCPPGIYVGQFEHSDPFPEVGYTRVQSAPGEWEFKYVSYAKWYGPNGSIELSFDRETQRVIAKRWAGWERPEKPSWYMSIAANLRRFAGKLGL